MNPIQTNSILLPLPAPPEAAAPDLALNRRDDHFYEEITRTNNELTNLQRELARQNAELAAAQKKLEASEHRYRSLSACSPIGILEMDPAGRCLYINAHWQAITGLSAGESLGDGWQRALDPADQAAFLAEWNPVLSAGLDFSREVRFVTTEGDQRWAQVRSRAILSQRGEIAAHVGTVEDITPRKQAEAALRKAHQELVDVSRRAGMAEVAASVLHNVGNVLNSVNVSAALAATAIRKSKVASLAKVVALLREHETDLAAFLSGDPKGRQLPGYLAQLAGHLAGEQTAALHELDRLQKNLEHINDIVALHQNYSRISSPTETMQIVDLVERTLGLSSGTPAGNLNQVVAEEQTNPPKP
jgi:PAS domain S-box-containing protein